MKRTGIILVVSLLALCLTASRGEAQIDIRTDVSWSPDGSLIAVSREDSVTIIDAVSQQVLNTFTDLPQQIPLAVWNTSGQLAFPRMNTVEIWEEVDSPTGAQLLSSVTANERVVTSVAWSPDDSKIVLGGGGIEVWDILSQSSVLQTYLHAGFLTDLAWSPDGSLIASSSVSKNDGVFIWNATTGQVVQQMILVSTTNTDPANVFIYPLSLDWGPDGSKLVISGSDGSVRIWDRTMLTDPQVFTQWGDPNVADVLPGTAWSVDWHPSGEWIASSGNNGRIVILNADTLEVVTVIETGATTSVEWSPDGTQLAYVDAGGNLEFTTPPGIPETPAVTPTFTLTETATPTPTNTATHTPTFTVTPSYTPTFTSTNTPTRTFTPSNTPTRTPTYTPTPTFTPTPPPNLIVNGDFSAGTTGWIKSANITWTVDGYLKVNLLTGTGNFYQDMAYPVTAGMPFEILFTARLSDNRPRNLQVTLRNAANLTGSFGCNFALPVTTTFRQYRIVGVTGASWSTTRLDFIPTSGTQTLHLDNVQVFYRPDLSVGSTQCIVN